MKNIFLLKPVNGDLEHHPFIETIRKVMQGYDYDIFMSHYPHHVEKIIKQLEKGETPDKQAYVDEEMFAHDNTVASVKVDGQDYPVTVVTDEVLKARKY